MQYFASHCLRGNKVGGSFPVGTIETQPHLSSPCQDLHKDLQGQSAENYKPSEPMVSLQIRESADESDMGTI
jgi:hypothetical protein